MQLIDDLRPLSLADYEHVIEMYAAECSAIPGVCAIYQFGNVGAPGLSDIDLVVVLDDDAPLLCPDFERLSIQHERWRREPLVGACFIHDVFVCPRNAFTHIDWIIPGNKWTLRAGVETEREDPAGEEQKMIELVHGLDFCIGRLHEFATLDDGTPRSVRFLVPQLWSLTHTQRFLVNAGVELEQSWAEVARALVRMRATPIDMLRVHEVGKLVPAVLAQFVNATDHFARLLAERAMLSEHVPTRECSIALHERRVLHVYKAATEQAVRTQLSALALARRLRFAGRTVEATWSRLELPGIILAHHLTYLALDARFDRLSSRIARRGGTRSGQAGSDVYQAVIARRWEIARQTDQSLRTLSVPLSGFRVPGLPVPAATASIARGTWRFRAVKSWLDWRLLPPGVVEVGA
jgi:hypothetical protein